MSDNREKKRIVILGALPLWKVFSHCQPRGNGHYAVWLSSLFRGLSKQSLYEIHWVTLSKTVKVPHAYLIDGQWIHLVPSLPLSLSVKLHFLPERLLVWQQLRNIKPHLVHSWGTEYCYGLLNRWHGAARLHSVQGAIHKYCKLAAMSPYEQIMGRREASVWSDIRLLTVESPWSGSAVLETAPDALPVIWEYAVEEHFFSKERKPAAEPTLLYGGSDTPIKNVDMLVRLFSRPELSHVRLWLAGVSGEKRPNLPSNIVPLGRVSRERMGELMQEAWGVIHPSKGDTGPTIAKESRVMRLPVIISNQCGSQQHICQGKSGYVLPLDDEDAWVKAVLDVCSSVDRSLEMGLYGSENCREALSAEKMTGELLRLYMGILGDGTEWQETRKRFCSEFHPASLG